MATLTISLPAQFITQINSEVKAQGATRSEFFRALLRKYFTKQIEFKPFVKIPLNQIEDGLRETGKYNDKFIKSVVKGFSKSSLYAS
jgi:hypothetical protein